MVRRRGGWRRFAVVAVWVVAGALAASGCRSRHEERAGAGAPPAAPQPPPPAMADADARPRIVVLGDSLTAGLGLSPEESFPALLQERVNRERLAYRVINAGVSGDTSAGGLSRLDLALDGNVRVLVVALGANDGLRGLPVETLSRNLSTIIERAQVRGVNVVLAGMEAPPNFGEGYTAAFHAAYSELARRHRVPFVPFLLAGVAGVESLNQRDGIHPTAEGARRVADNVWPVLAPVVTTP